MARPVFVNSEYIGDLSPGWKWAGIFLLVSILMGLSILVVPPYYVIAGLLLLVFLVYLAVNPEKAFYLSVFTIPFTDRVRLLPISFSLNDMLIFYTALICCMHIVLKEQKFSFRTSLDGWMMILVGMFFLAGVFSESDTGLLGFFKIFEGFVVYYMVIYLIRTRQITRSQILRVLLFTVLFQAGLGIFQSFTGIGADFESNRGYLGYLGLGSSHVWHGRGTTWHFNTLGNFLVTSLVLFTPLFVYVIKRKKWALFLGGIVLLGIITTYSRGSLLGLGAGIVFFLGAVQPNLRKVFLFVGGFLLLVAPAIFILSNSSYVQTVSYNERLIVWQVPLAAITSSTKAFWLGSGLNSYSVVAWPYIPAWVPPDQYRNWFAHNFYLLTAVEVGVIGACILFGFLAYIWLDSWKKFRSWHGFLSVYSLSVSGAMITLFFVSIFDHTFAAPHFKIFIFLLLGLLYVKRTSISEKSIEHDRA